MMSIMSITLLASGTALLLSIGALCVAVHLLRRYRFTSSYELLTQVSALASTVEELTLAHRNHRAAANMRARRGKPDSPDSSTASNSNSSERDASKEATKRELTRKMILKNGGTS